MSRNTIRRAAARAAAPIIALVVAGCAGFGTPPPLPAPKGEARYLIDPRIGYPRTVAPAVDRRFDTAWRAFLTGDYADSRRRLADLHSRNPEYLPASLAEAAIDIVQGQVDAAAGIVTTAEARVPEYTAARVYEAEIAVARHDTQRAYDLYNAIAQQPNAPSTVADRVKMLRDRLFNELFTAAQNAQGPEATRLLREALAINAGDTTARIQLASHLIAERSFDEALQVLGPIVNSPDAGKPDVQAALAEIEVGHGNFQAAMNRYERLERLTHDARYARRLEQIKEAWNEANLPPQYQMAIESQAIDRADFAVLLYWKVPSVRFAQNLGTPPIAIDIEALPGREEIIRALALGLYDVDPVTRRVSPNRLVNAAALTRLGARALLIGGASCARSVPYQRDETLRAQSILAACGISDPSATVPPDSPVTGQTAAAMLDQIENKLTH